MKILIMSLMLLSSCTRAPVGKIENSMRLTKSIPEFSDSYSDESLLTSLKKHIDVIKNSNKVSDPMIFGPIKITKEKYIQSLVLLAQKIELKENWKEWLKNNFDFYEVYGNSDWSYVLVTGYYEPRVFGSRVKTNEFDCPVYKTPDDLYSLAINKFIKKDDNKIELITNKVRIENKKIIPYFDRKEIDQEKKLSNKNLELAWLNPIDAFFIQIQGSGLVEFEDGSEMRIGYAEQNGYNYVAIGKYLTNVIPLEKMSMQNIKNHLKNLTNEKRQEILNLNPSYVFFQKLNGESLTYIGTEVSDNRTIATDKSIFPKGALAFLDISIPNIEHNTDSNTQSFIQKPRLVFDQDTGGAIKGAGRVDLYFGKDENASQMAGMMKQSGRLYYLVPRI